MRLPVINFRVAPVRGGGIRAFTLLEVVLAISIAVGILVVALLFHHQSAHLRTQLLEESERLAAVRQIMERLASDLRASPGVTPTGFAGGGNFLRFVMAGLPAQTNVPESDLKLVAYTVTTNLNGTNIVVSGIARVEGPVPDELPALAARRVVELGELGETNAPPAQVNEPLTEVIHFLHFRFWDGIAWREEWSQPSPPPGVEVSLGFDPLPPETTPDKYPGDLFRRVIYVPAGARSAGTTTNNMASSGSETK